MNFTLTGKKLIIGLVITILLLVFGLVFYFVFQPQNKNQLSNNSNKNINSENVIPVEKGIQEEEPGVYNEANIEVSVEDLSSDDWETYLIDELGISFQIPKIFEVKRTKELEYEKGKKISISVFNERDIVFNLMVTTEDYELEAGEGCCFIFVKPRLDLDKNYEREIESLNPFKIREQKIDNKLSVRFYRVNQYVSAWVVDSVIIPNNGIFPNIFISGPVLYNTQEFQDRISNNDIYKIEKDFYIIEENIKKQEFFEAILKSIKFDN